MPELPWVPPMLATAARELPAVPDDWSAEVKYDGMRVQALIDGGTLRLRSRTGRDVTASFPELAVLARAAEGRPLILDGEIIAPDPDGLPSFALLQRRMGRARPGPQVTAAFPVTFMAFDLLHLSGRSLLGTPYEQRRALLGSLPFRLPAGDVAPAWPGDAAEVAAVTRELGLEGVMLKRLGSRYQPGRRSRTWLKVKHVRVADVVVGGWLPGRGWRSRLAGALLAGIPGPEGLRYAGEVGSGLAELELRRLTPLLSSLSAPDPPFTGPLPPELRKQARWVRPVLQAEVAYAELTPAGRLRQPVWRGLRPDQEHYLL